MWYQDVSDKEFVIAAIKEFGTLKRDKFLDEYGFARARIYFVLYNGEYYDCKPILWAAYKHQFGKLPVSHASNGVNRTVRPKLESMGFRVCAQKWSAPRRGLIRALCDLKLEYLGRTEKRVE